MVRALVSALVLALATLPSAALAEQDGLSVMRLVETAMRSPGERMEVVMQIERPGVAAESRTFTMWTLSGKEASKALIRFDAPATIARTALLSVTRASGGQDNWLYVPSLRQTRRVAPQDRSEAFVQSDFTIEDLSVAVDPARRVYTRLGEVACGGRRCVQVQDAPKDEAAAKESGYGRVVLYADAEVGVVHRVDFYDKGGALLKVLQADGLRTIGALWRFDRAALTNVQKGTRTVMTVTKRGEGVVDDSVFNASTLDAL